MINVKPVTFHSNSLDDWGFFFIKQDANAIDREYMCLSEKQPSQSFKPRWNCHIVHIVFTPTR